MRVRLVGRYDALLLAALTVATVVLFGRGIQHLLDVARDVEVRLGVALLPALVVLTAAFIVHQTLKRQAANAQAMAHAAAAEQAESRARELEQLMAFGGRVARTVSLDALRDMLARHLSHLFAMRDIAVWSYRGGSWNELVGSETIGRDTILRVAERATGGVAAPALRLSIDDRVMAVPLAVGDRVVGLIATPVDATPRWDPESRRLLEATAPLIAIALRNAQLFDDLEKTALLDPLTGCYTRAHGVDLLDVELRRARRTDSPLSVVMFDVDRFKEINDGRGHLAGDAALAAIGRRLAQLLRRTDVRCRYGGDEFLLILPDTQLEAAALVAEVLRREVERLGADPCEALADLTISVGVAQAAEDDRDTADVIGRADKALYAAKASGRNSVRLYEAERPRRVEAPPRALQVM